MEEIIYSEEEKIKFAFNYLKNKSINYILKLFIKHFFFGQQKM